MTMTNDNEIPATQPTIPELKERLLVARQVAASAKEAKDAIAAKINLEVAAFREKLELGHVETFAAASVAATALEEADTALREELISRYNQTGQKTFDKHLSVRVNTLYEYDATDATEWAKKEATFLLTVDTKAFCKLPDLDKLEFVTKKTTVTAVIAKELS
jgi:hypothetical protein